MCSELQQSKDDLGVGMAGEELGQGSSGRNQIEA